MARYLATLLFVSALCRATELCPALKEALASYQMETDPRRKERLLGNLTEVERFSRCYLEFVHATLGFKDFLRRIEALRTDRQSGAGPSGAGGTTLVARGAAARTLSLAAEYGAVTQSVSGQVITFRGNLAGLPAALVRKDVFPYCDPRTPTTQQPDFCVESSALGQLRKFSFGLSFDAGRSAGSPPAPPSPSGAGAASVVRFSGDKTELSSFSLRYEVWNRKDVSSPLFQKAWQDKLAEQRQIPELARKLSAGFEPVFEKLGASQAYAAWQAETRERIRTAADPEGALRSQMSRLATLLLEENIVTAEDVRELRQMLSRYGFEQDELMELTGSQPVIAVEYSYNRPLLEIPESALRFVFDLPVSKRWSLAVNTAWTFHHAVPGGARSRVRHLKALELGAQAERVLGGLPSLGPVTLGAAVYVQYRNSPPVLRASGWNAVIAEAGTIAAAQLRLTLGPPGGLRFPLAVSYSNRTELLPTPAWRAQLGLSYDFDFLFLP
jgi:hypothetical protein